jgi:Protein of unknown function (DUF2652)
MGQNNTKPALLFVPDISGFTQFVKHTEIEHSQHIIKELLENLIEANEMGLQVSEVEGDAILFYRFGNPPTAEEFFQQVKKMFVTFHSQLKLYDTQRICQCGACSTMQNLTLKIVSHYGNITQTKIKEHSKLFGQDVITVHRLLKNDISNHEYALYTDTVGSNWEKSNLPDWVQKLEGQQEYDVGIINYNYAQLSPLKQLVPDPTVQDFSIPGITLQVFTYEEEINCSPDIVLEILSDHSLRLQWMQGSKEIVYFGQQLNRVGTKHRCIVDKDSPVMVTSKFMRDSEKIIFAETDEAKKMCSVYTIRKINDGQSSVRVDGLLKNNLLLKLFFNLKLKKKICAFFDASMRNLKRYCEDLYIKQQV